MLVPLNLFLSLLDIFIQFFDLVLQSADFFLAKGKFLLQLQLILNQTLDLPIFVNKQLL